MSSFNGRHEGGGDFGGAILLQPPPSLGFDSSGVQQPQPVESGSLSYLKNSERLNVRQSFEELEIICGYEMNNRYKIFDVEGRQIFSAKEDTDCCTRQCYGPIRPFDLLVKDAFSCPIISLQRPLACQYCCFPCCLQTLEVFISSGAKRLAGVVEQQWTFWTPHFHVKNTAGEVVAQIKGPFWTTAECGNNVEFQIMSSCGNLEVGKITKVWGGFCRELFTDADRFFIDFPAESDVETKATLLGALFLIDFMYFERANH